MLQTSLWITGSTRSGKTTCLVNQFRQWVEQGLGKSPQSAYLSSRMNRRDRQIAPAILIFAANDDNRRELGQLLTTAIQGRYPVRAKTPLGFFQDEVMLFWPLLIQRLNLRAQFPLRLRPETEQELATELWATEMEHWSLQVFGTNEYTRVRRILDLLLLAGVGGTPIEDIPLMLKEGIPEEEGTPEVWERVGKMLLDWQHWCLERGLLTYGILTELYWSQLLPDSRYQQHLKQRYRAVVADDVDDYPAIARDLFECLLEQGAVGAFTYNPDGKVRLGLNADPNYLEGLAGRCQIEALETPPNSSLASTLGDVVLELAQNPILLTGLPESIQSIQTTSRAALLRKTAQVIIEEVKSGHVAPGEIAVIAPGLDPIARYTLREILTSSGIPVEPLNDQRPLISSPMIQALLTLLALVYPGLGRLVDRDAIAQMLVVLSQREDAARSRDTQADAATQQPGEEKKNVEELSASSPSLVPHIDPVRAGLLADYCFAPDPEQPRLLPVESFARWDRLGHRATAAYTEIVAWLNEQRSQQQQHLISSCVVVLDRAIQKFLWNGSNLPYDAIAALRELMETAQHYWEVDARLRKTPRDEVTVTSVQLPSINLQTPPDAGARAGNPSHTTIAKFIGLLRRGTVTANPYPVRRLAPEASGAVTLATIFQYRASRRSHRWHFWLDASSHLWEIGGAATLFGAPIFLKEWSGRPWTEEDRINADEERLQRILRDLLGRVSERIYLCHSDLAVNGTEQTSGLSALVHASVPVEA
ncbi:MAG TPA: recombinase family protein [Allocoleopsis sp.]